MKLLKNRTLLFVASSLMLAAVMGGSLGVVAAGSRGGLGAGFNLIGGPLNDQVTAQKFVSCLPAGSWDAVYIWDGTAQKWQHYFNTANGTPAYVNALDAGGINNIPRFAGVVLIMKTAVASPFVPERPADTCP